MKKKIKELTQEEMTNICRSHMREGTSCLNECSQNCKCPLWFAPANSCLKGFIERLQCVESKISL